MLVLIIIFAAKSIPLRKTPILHLLLLLFTSLTAFSQHLIVFEENQKESYLVKYSFSPDANELVTNYFLDELAKNSGKPTANVQYSFSFNELLRITKLGNNSFQASFELKDGNCSGDNKYKGFSLSSPLLPSSVDIEAKIVSQRNEIVKSFTLKDIKIKNGFSIGVEMNFGDTLARNYKLQIDNKNFHYNSQSQKQFNQLKNLIEDYYASEAKLSVCSEKLQSIHFENIDMLTLYDYTLDDAEKIIEKIENHEFPEKLNLKVYDPIHFLTTYNNISNSIAQARTQLNKMLSTLDLIYYNKGMEYAGVYNFDKAIPYFDKAKEINPMFAPAYYQLALAYFNSYQLTKAADNILFVLNKTRPDNTLLNESINLAKNIYQGYISEAKKLNSQEKYYEAVDKLDVAKTFCTSSKYLQCSDEIFRTMVVSKKGIYTYYTSIAQKALISNSTELAEKYAQQAYDFQQLNKEWIPKAYEANEILSAVALIYADKGIKQNLSQNYRSALNQLEKSVFICKTHEFINCSDKIEGALNIAHNGIYASILSNINQQLNNNQLDLAESLIDTAKSYQMQYAQYIQSAAEADVLLNRAKYQRYSKCIADGKQFLSINLNESALFYLDQARELEKNYSFKKDVELTLLLQKTAKPILLNKISDGKVKAWGNDLSLARNILTNVQQSQTLYNLDGDKEIDLAIAEFRAKISLRECQNFQDEFDINLSKANQQSKEKFYIYATKSLNDALLISQQHSNCNISPNQAQELKARLEPATTYQEMLLTANQLLENNDFQKTLEKYSSAIEYYKTKEIDKFNLSLLPLEEWVCTKNNNNFLAFSSNYFYSNNDLNKAFSLLKKLQTRNYPQNYAIQLQEAIAKALAIRDKSTTPTPEPKAILNQYTANDKWFKSFNKAYLKACKN